MDLRSLRQRLSRIAGASATEETRPPRIRLRLAGAIPGVHRCGPALVTVVSPEERRPELERQRAENERITGRPARDTLDETLAMETREAARVAANPAASARILDRVLGMNSEQRADMLAELDAKITAANGGTKQWT